MKTRIEDIEGIFKEVFNDDVVNSIDTVYEKSDDEKFLKLIISIHGLSAEDVSIIHTKFIFRTDLHKRNIIEDSFIYLYDINCVYHKVEFDNLVELKDKINDIVESNDFGTDIRILSDFIEAPAMFLNYYLKKEGITEYSIFNVEYEPKFKTVSCEKVTFDFKVNINNNYHMEVSIHKIDKDVNKDELEDSEMIDKYKFQFKFMDEIETIETDTIKNIHYSIGSNIAKILDRKLKNN